MKAWWEIRPSVPPGSATQADIQLTYDTMNGVARNAPARSNEGTPNGFALLVKTNSQPRMNPIKKLAKVCIGDLLTIVFLSNL
jgi:hypothetical protein